MQDTDLDRESVIRRLNAHLATLLPFRDHHRVTRVDWRALLQPRRFDVMAKAIYARSHLSGHGKEWADELYRAHLEVWGGFVEGDGSGKDSYAKYRDGFDGVIEQIAADGFDPARSLIPVDADGVIIDGAHRAAACIALEQDAWVVSFDYRVEDYTADRFRDMGLSRTYLDAMAVEYARLDRDSRVVCLFPAALDKQGEVERLLMEYGSLVYRKPVVFDGYGPQNLIAQLYRDEAWLGRREEGWPGSLSHVEARFVEGKPVWFYSLSCRDPQQMRQLKERIRALCGIGNYAVHVNDTPEETFRLCGQVFNAGSMDLFNHGNLSFSQRTLAMQAQFKDEILRQDGDPEAFCVDGSSVMALYGLREGNDYDYLALDTSLTFSNPLISCHNDHAGHYAHSIDRLVTDPRLFLRYDGVKYITLDVLEQMKLSRGEGKDVRDVAMIERLKEGVRTHSTGGCRPLPGSASPKARLKSWVRNHVPGEMRAVVNASVEQVYTGFRTLRRLPDYLRRNPRFSYRGFSVRYGAGDALIDRVRAGALYEPEVTRALIRLLQGVDRDATMLDIGANIGLISLNILSLMPSTRIHAFEPGPRSAAYLRETLSLNSLHDRISLHPYALSNQAGSRAFAMHGRRHSSGDGFADTGRAGGSRSITVQTTTLDGWWSENGCPEIHVIKVDTEGSELWVLEGARALIGELRPAIVLEINATNLQAYEHGPEAIERFFKEHRYRLTTLAGTPVPRGELERFLTVANDFVATSATNQSDKV